MSFTIRSATVSDASAIACCLLSLGYQNSDKDVAAKIATLADSPADAVLVAVDASAGVIGVVSVHVLPLFHAPGNLARLTALVVLEAHRRSGVGSALVRAAEQFAWEHECLRVEVTSGDHRAGAHAFYEQVGYQLDERRFIKHGRAAV